MTFISSHSSNSNASAESQVTTTKYYYKEAAQIPHVDNILRWMIVFLHSCAVILHLYFGVLPLPAVDVYFMDI